MNTIIKLGLAALAVGAFSGTTSLGDAETRDPSNPFTRHGLPIPGAYFKAKESQQAATFAVSKSGQGVGEGKQPVSKVEKKRATAHSSAVMCRSGTILKSRPEFVFYQGRWYQN